MSLPPPAANQAFCNVSALEAGRMKLPLAWVLADMNEDEFVDAPILSFLVRHHTNNDTLVFDLGFRKDWKNLPPALVKRAANSKFEPSVPLDIVDSLSKGGSHPSDIRRLFILHMHVDHIGHSPRFPTSQFFVGEGWPALGPFLRALDFYGDGSVYVVDAGHGHIPGHINLLVRTTADGGWVYLAGDSAHHWNLLTGTGKIGHHPLFGCAHVDSEAAKKHIERIKVLMRENPRVRVILAHDQPWFKANEGGPAFWPGIIESL